MASKRVTVFGGSGFLGRQIVMSLAAEGMNVRVGVRHPERASFLERLGRGGQIELVHADVWDGTTVAEALVGSNDEEAKRHVIGLAGSFGFETTDAGALSNARYLEPVTELLIQLAYGKGMGTGIGFALVNVAEAKAA